MPSKREHIRSHVDELLFEKLPGLHPEHSEEPSFGEYWPAWHGTHPDACGFGFDPAGHAVSHQMRGKGGGEGGLVAC